MYIFIPFVFFLWGGLTVAYFHFGFQPEWLASILGKTAASDSAVNAFMFSTRGGLVIIGVGIFCLLWIVIRFRLGIDKFEDAPPSGSVREAIAEIFFAFLTPASSHDEPEKEANPLSIGTLLNELSDAPSSGPEYLRDSNGKNVRITGRGSNVTYLENGDVVYTKDGQDYHTTDNTDYHNYE